MYTSSQMILVKLPYAIVYGRLLPLVVRLFHRYTSFSEAALRDSVSETVTTNFAREKGDCYH
jgi:hypothetical protein